MSNTQKRPGVRDISDLKARLGLTKRDEGAAKADRVFSGANRGASVPGGVVPPPGVKPGRENLPPPPGAAPAHPPQSDDLFGAMNAMAAQQAAHRAAAGPEIVVVEKGEKVANVSRRALMVRLARVGAPLAGFLVLGVVVGQIGTNAKRYNGTIEGSGRLHEDVERVRRSLGDLLNLLQRAPRDARDTGKLGKHMSTLTSAKLETPSPEVLATSEVSALNKELVAEILDFYSAAQRLKNDLNEHVKLTSAATTVLSDAALKRRAGQNLDRDGLPRSPYRYGVIVEVPSGEEARPGRKPPAVARVVEMGKPICDDGLTSTSDSCANETMGFNYRTRPGSTWDKLHLATPEAGATQVEQQKLILLVQTEAFDDLVEGHSATVSEMGYQERLKNLEAETTRLLGLGEAISVQLKARGGESPRFTFFL